MHRRLLALALPCFLLLGLSPAFANGSLQCDGRPYAVEIQFSLSTGQLTELIVANTASGGDETERFSLQQRFVDHRRQFMRARGTGLDRPQVAVALRVAGATGTLSYRGTQYELRCNWTALG
ncbi:hypothetical protein BKP43_20930 [Variovorax boronicumulans]|uniref:hypothetical protein n=1 Tax=Variovorax boronicumulans TaxID=436515 RepID=UPI000BB3D12F|nr:hypothetical protein [Variovorax boronicumulans]PBI92156.1 hypothetical protein BKP43_20930 [Variovorax boronicumulans]